MIILCGKSSSGKDTIRNQLIESGMEPVVCYTTRPPREGEIDGITYHYTNDEWFLKKKAEGFFAETTSYVVANGDTWYYGSAVEDLTSNKVAIMNPYGVRELKKHKELNPIAFYIMADEDTIWNRLRQRGDNSEQARCRLNEDAKDFQDITKYIDFAIRNDGAIEPSVLADIILGLYKRWCSELAQ